MTKREDFFKSYFNGFNGLFPSLTEEEFIGYYDESTYGGYPEEPGGSVWESEGKSIYTLIRILKPKRIAEIGNYVGVSTNHILQAVEKNGVGEVFLIDIVDRLNYAKIHTRKFNRIVMNSIDYFNNVQNFDLIVQDGDHTYKHVKHEIELFLKNNQVSNYHIWSHDYYQREMVPQCEVWRAWDEMKNKFNQFVPFRDSVSNCGFSIAKK